MLAYELFLQNPSPSGTSLAVRYTKKVYYRKGTVEIDRKTPEEYGDAQSSDMRDLLSMPRNISPGLGLPIRITGTNQARPYVELFGQLSKGRDGVVFSISKEGRNSVNRKEKILFSAKYSAKSGVREIEANGLMKLNIDRKHYFVEGKSLYDLYIESGILTQKGELAGNVFSAVCNAFFDDVSKRPIQDIKIRRAAFSLYVLSSQKEVEYREEEIKGDQEAGIDSFSNRFSYFPNKGTQTAKFLSYDDRAFTINFLQGSSFWKNLYIGNVSHERINVDPVRLIQIAGLVWSFAYMGDPDFRFEDTKRGIYDQLWCNYNKLKERAGDPLLERAQVMVLCIQRSQAKQEVLLHENLTMDRMRTLFGTVKDRQEIPLFAVESLINQKNRNTIWSDYINVVRAFITGRSIDRGWLTAIFLRKLRGNISAWIKEPSEASKFFAASEFCRTFLSRSYANGSVNDAEDYAYKVGRIAGKYIKFKESAGESSSSLRDILAYSKYDREKLRFVIQRVGLGISLSKADKKEIDLIAKFVNDEMSEVKEISDSIAHADYSYFFYKGAFETMV